jgi:predicted Zn finger-like uncharacterized protein
MALATKCPHCNTVFRVAHDQLKLRGGIVRCGACNEVFDGNAALLEPPTPLPVSPLPEALPFDQKMAALDTRAAEVLAAEEAEPLLEFDTVEPAEPDDTPALADAEPAAGPAPQAAAPSAEASPAADLTADVAPDDFAAVLADDEPESDAAPAPFPLPAEPATLPADRDALFDLDLEMESEPDLEASIDPELAPQAQLDEVISTDTLSDAELEAALEAELAVMEQSLGDVQHDADGQPLAGDYDSLPGGRREPTWDEPPQEELQAGAGPGVSAAFAAAADAVFAADAGDTRAADNDNDNDSDDAPGAPPPAPPAGRPLRDDELEEVDEEALVQLSSAGMSQAHSTRTHAYLHAASAEESPAHEDHAEPDEPGFVKRDRLRRKYGKATTIAMSLGSVLLVAALFGQAITTFRNTLAAAMPPLKPALTAACTALGCKIELPTQIDDLTIEQGELQTLSETAFSFATLLRNQSATAQAWPSIELTLDDANDKRILRRVFTPRDYLSPDVAMDKGFAPHTEQAVKLYFELHDLKASGYHIAVFYP